MAETVNRFRRVLGKELHSLAIFTQDSVVVVKTWKKGQKNIQQYNISITA
jgi:hypothetical protein